MHPEICRVGFFTVYSYGLMLAIAFIVSSALAGRYAREINFPKEVVFNFTFIVFVFGIAGARLLYVLQNLKDYWPDPLEVFMLQHGGLSWFGGLLLGSISGIVYIRSKKLSVYQVLDVIAPFAALGQAIGRIGCLLNGCCYGKPSASGLYFPSQDAILIPAQLYSSLLLLCLFIVLRLMQQKPHRQGVIILSYLMFYSLKRFFVEYWRGDASVVFFGLTLFQVCSIVLFFSAAVALTFIKKRTNGIGVKK